MDERVALITGGSMGLGRALTEELSWRGWRLVVDARDERAPARGGGRAAGPRPRHRRRRRRRRPGSPPRARAGGGGGGPAGPAGEQRQRARAEPAARALADFPLDELARVLAVNAVAPLALAQRFLPRARAHAAGGSSTSRPTPPSRRTPGWGGYGAAKAALDQLSAVLAVEHPAVAIYAFDPGDMAHRADAARRSPGEDTSDLPSPESVVPALMRLVDGRPAERAVPRRRPPARRGGAGVSARSLPAPAGRVHAPARQRGRRAARARAACRATGCACSWRGPRGSPTAASATCPTCCARATCSWSTPRRRWRRRSTAAREDGRPLVVHVSTALDDGDWVVEPRRGRRRRARTSTVAAGERLALPGGVRAAARRAVPRRRRAPPGRLWRAAASPAGRRRGVPRARTAARSATPTAPRP